MIRQILYYVIVRRRSTYWNSVGIFSPDFLTLGFPLLERVFLLVLELHFLVVQTPKFCTKTFSFTTRLFAFSCCHSKTIDGVYINNFRIVELLNATDSLVIRTEIILLLIVGRIYVRNIRADCIICLNIA